MLITIGEYFRSRGENCNDNIQFFMHCQYFQNTLFLSSLVNENLLQKKMDTFEMYIFRLTYWFLDSHKVIQPEGNLDTKQPRYGNYFWKKNSIIDIWYGF